MISHTGHKGRRSKVRKRAGLFAEFIYCLQTGVESREAKAIHCETNKTSLTFKSPLCKGEPVGLERWLI